MNELQPFFSAALEYAVDGVAVFPCKPRAKEPLTAHGYKDATNDLPQIVEWREQHPTANIGRPTGNGIVVIDIDERNGGGETLHKLEAELGLLPRSSVVKTSGGYHYYFAYAGPKLKKPNTWKGIDVKGDGGYVIAPPSIHPSGKQYVQETSGPLTTLPDTWLGALTAESSADSSDGVSLSERAEKCRAELLQMPQSVEGDNGSTTLLKGFRKIIGDGFAGPQGQILAEWFATERSTPSWPKHGPQGWLRKWKIALTSAEREGAVGSFAIDDTPNGEEFEIVEQPERPGPIIVCLKDVKPAPVRWLWQSRIPCGRLTCFAGIQGMGKSFVSLDLAARITTGRAFPDGASCEQGSVLVICAEDEDADTIKPRIVAMQGNDALVHTLRAVRSVGRNGKMQEVMFTLADRDNLEIAIKQIPNLKLIIIDPIGSFTGGTIDSYRDTEVRSVLAPVALIAAKYDVAVFYVAHVGKSKSDHADFAVLGSVAFTALARSVIHLIPDSENPKRLLFLPGKCNLAKRPDGLAMSIVGDEPGRVEWELKPVAITANDAIAAPRLKPGPASLDLDEAERFLLVAMGDSQPKPAKSLIERAEHELAISKRTLQRARKGLGIVAYQPEIPGPWFWAWPGTEGIEL